MFRHPDYNPDRAQKLISSSMSRHLLTRNISSKSMHAFFSNLVNRNKQTDKRGQRHLPPPLSDVKNTTLQFSYISIIISHSRRECCCHYLHLPFHSTLIDPGRPQRAAAIDNRTPKPNRKPNP